MSAGLPSASASIASVSHAAAAAPAPKHEGRQANVTLALGPAAALNPLVVARSPGPIYMPRYGAVSTFPTPPVTLFQAAPRYPPSSKADGTPGPGAYPPQSTVSHRAASMRSREQFGSSVRSSAADGPGPGEYPRADTGQTRKRNQPRFSIKGRRPPLKSVLDTPAPNTHQHMEPFNKRQHLAKLPNPPCVRIGPPPKLLSGAPPPPPPSAASPAAADGGKGGDGGKSGDGGKGDAAADAAPAPAEAAAAKATGSGKHSAAAALAYATPGPSEYVVDPCYRLLSTIQTVPSFTLLPRRPPLKNAGLHITPEFHNVLEGIGKQPLSQKKTAPSVSFSGRVKFGSVYG